ncbi:hypothetical protein [Sorangium sp. So ce385]|uniref:hypothetical protein n=1 Tax=Sorangium sp. So ce385 TaxID=3133308 RepID=UPI003F5C73E8
MLALLVALSKRVRDHDSHPPVEVTVGGLRIQPLRDKYRVHETADVGGRIVDESPLSLGTEAEAQVDAELV